MAANCAVSVVLPAYNEEDTIAETVETTVTTLESFLPTNNYEVLIAEDGCDDRTPDIASGLAVRKRCVEHIHSDERLGRGGALNKAFRESSGRTLVYFDTDLATDMRHLETLVECIRTEQYDIATGSRWLSSSDADRSADRATASWVYNQLVKLFLNSELHDHQCGFKAFDRDALFDLLTTVDNKHWFWDTEVLVRAQADGYEVTEFPVDWTPKPDTKVNLVEDATRMGQEILRLWWDMSVENRLPISPEDVTSF